MRRFCADGLPARHGSGLFPADEEARSVLRLRTSSAIGSRQIRERQSGRSMSYRMCSQADGSRRKTFPLGPPSSIARTRRCTLACVGLEFVMAWALARPDTYWPKEWPGNKAVEVIRGIEIVAVVVPAAEVRTGSSHSLSLPEGLEEAIFIEI